MNKSLLPIFYSEFNASPNWDLIDELEFCIKTKLIQIQAEDIAKIEEFYNVLDKGPISDGPGPQGKGHMSLKTLAQNWLSKQGKTSKTEVFYAGLHPDVISDSSDIIIECGSTDPACIPIYLPVDGVNYVGIVPFPHLDDVDINLYKFIKTNEYLTYLNDKKLTWRENLKKFTRYRRLVDK